MRKQKQVINLGGVDFEFKGTISKDNISISHKTLSECYTRPSTIKEDIYKMWRSWFINNFSNYNWGICSYNANVFTIHGTVEHSKRYYVYITKVHNYIYEIV